MSWRATAETVPGMRNSTPVVICASVLPNYLIVGAPKCGTSSLARWLEQHPDVYMVPEKELHFFTGFWEQGLDWYKQCFAANGEPRVGEASPSYLADPVA